MSVKPMTDEQLAVADHEDLVVEIRRLREENEEATRMFNVANDANTFLQKENAKLREENEELRKFRDADIGQINVLEAENAKLRKVVDAAKECVEVNDDGSYRLLVLDYDLGVFQKLYNALRELDEGEK